jgi:hypothetical protein
MKKKYARIAQTKLWMRSRLVHAPIYYIIKMQVESATWRLHVNLRKSMKKEKI